MSSIEPNSYTWTCPYDGLWIEHFYSRHFKNLYGAKIVRERDLREKLAGNGSRPEIMLMGNFVRERAGIASLCHDSGIETIHSEDGFFPHYSTIHVDPAGFCWESSLPRMVFRKITDKQRVRAREVRTRWLDFRLPGLLLLAAVAGPRSEGSTAHAIEFVRSQRIGSDPVRLGSAQRG